MFGKNTITKVQTEEQYKKDNRIGIVEIFQTLQGEGPFSGVPAVFIRTKDCCERCYFCDTEFSSGEMMTINEITDRVNELTIKNTYGPPLVVITGGEPLIWLGISDLVETLLDSDSHAVQIETCGAVYGSELPWMAPYFYVVCSPKTAKLNVNIEMNADVYKYIITAGEIDKDDGLPNMSTQIRGKKQRIARPPEETEVFVTPCDPHTDDDQYDRNMKEAISSCLNHGYTFNIQLHKIIGLP